MMKVRILEVDANLFKRKTRASVFKESQTESLSQASEQRTAKKVQRNFLYD